MIRYTFYLLFFIIFGCTKTSNNFNKQTEKEEIDVFFENFIQTKKKDYNFKKNKYVRYGDSLEFKYWIKESGVDTTYLKKYFNSKRPIAFERPVIFTGYKPFDFEEFYTYKRKNTNSNLNDSVSINANQCELISFNFLVFNEEKNRVLIYYSLNCHNGYVEVYAKKSNQWFLLKEISEITQ